MDSLRTAVEEHAFWLIALPKEPLFDSMRGTRQFESRCKWDLVKREEVIRQGLRLADFGLSGWLSIPQEIAIEVLGSTNLLVLG